MENQSSGTTTSHVRKKRRRARALNVSRSGEATAIREGSCPECGKRFRSPKALHGHMRTHPEREWRGMNAPTRHCLNRDVTDRDDHEAAACLVMLADSAPLIIEGFECPSSKINVGGGTNDDIVESCGDFFGVFESSTGPSALGGNVRFLREKDSAPRSSNSVNALLPLFDPGFELNLPSRIDENYSDAVGGGDRTTRLPGLDLRLALSI